MSDFVSETIYTSAVVLIFTFQNPALPPELWREIMRWATLPPSGRLPLDDSLTMLDPWPVGMPSMLYQFLYLYPETAYGFEQSCLYPTKRALMLVSKAWAELAVEFMYESLVVDYYGVGRQEQVIALLEGSAGLLLKKWVKRVDVFENPLSKGYACTKLARIGFPNLRVQNLFYHYHCEIVPFGVLLSEQPLHLAERCGSQILDRATSRDEAFGSLRCLTLWMLEPTHTPFQFPSNLRRLTIIVFETTYFQVQHFFSTSDSVALPTLTHLTLHHRYQFPDRLMLSMEMINRIGPQLRHLTISAVNGAQDWTECDLRTILRVCTQLTELAIPSHMETWEADHGDYRHSILQTLGIPITRDTSEQDLQLSFDVFSRREAFPKLSTIRLVSVSANPREANQWLEPHALRLRDHGIRLEDYSGRDVLPVLVLENQN